MKKINKIYSALALTAALGLTSCIEETFPKESVATSDQISQSASALEGSVNGIPAQMSQGYLVYGNQTHETDMGYPLFMIAQTELLGDMYPGGSNIGYDWYVSYNTLNYNIGPDSYDAYLPWFTLYKFIKSANDIISTVNIEDENTSDVQKGYAGVAYACRAFDYFMLTSCYEPMENKYTDVSAVKGLTVPFVLNTTTPDEAKNNPRVPHDEMIAFILSDLDKAESCLKNFSPKTKQVPNLAVVYGIRAKVYMWDEDYANAAKYARLAIETANAQPMTETEWTDPKSGFTKACDSWMWYITYSAENMGNLCNFVGWMSNEDGWGYSTLTMPMIDKSLYDKIGSTDFRKHVFLDPERYDYYNYQTSRDKEYIEELPAYAALKFRCANGDYNTYSVGGATDVPVMRVEEMYFIDAIATAASESVEAGKAKLNSFMQTYRDPNFSAKSVELRDFEIEALDQMRIEFWGEGNAFPIAKRLKVGTMQNYAGTNCPSDILKLNCEGIKPNWNFVIPTTEIQSNVALEGKNNPDPTKTVQCPSPEGQYGAKN